MLFDFSVLGFLALTLLKLTLVSASRLSYELQGYANQCFYFTTTERLVKTSLYFAVYRGDDFEVDFDVKDPANSIIVDGKAQRQGDYVFTANNVGEYSFCFQNPTGSIKVLDLDIIKDGDQDNHSPLKFKDPKHLSNMEEALNSIQKLASQAMRDQRFFRTKEGRNENVIREVSSRVHYFAIMVVVIVGFMSIIQVLAIRSFFSSKSRY